MDQRSRTEAPLIPSATLHPMASWQTFKACRRGRGPGGCPLGDLTPSPGERLNLCFIRATGNHYKRVGLRYTLYPRVCQTPDHPPGAASVCKGMFNWHGARDLPASVPTGRRRVTATVAPSCPVSAPSCDEKGSPGLSTSCSGACTPTSKLQPTFLGIDHQILRGGKGIIGRAQNQHSRQLSPSRFVTSTKSWRKPSILVKPCHLMSIWLQLLPSVQ